MSFFGGQFAVLKKGLDRAWLRQKAIASNIANADTPGYKAVDVDFKSVFDAEQSAKVKKTNPKHITPPEMDGDGAAVTVRRDISMRLDGNNVDIESEMKNLAQNQLLYQTLLQKLARQFANYKHVISEGKQ